jgi:hypothetical protein
MEDINQRLEALDVMLFENIRSQSNEGDKRSLLAVQRATANRHESYTYLEIGSHLGGSIQPHLLDHRCEKIYSIDPRPRQQSDDRSPGFVSTYEDNSTERMLDLLKEISPEAVSKIQCFELDASDVDPDQITMPPQLSFIDGEHTDAAVTSDFQFCRKVTSDDGAIVFHDFDIISSAILELCKGLDRENRKHVPVKLEGSVFAIFFDPETVRSDPYLAECRANHTGFMFRLKIKLALRRILPGPVWKALKVLRDVASGQ